MRDSTSTKLSFLVGLVAALVLVPVLALAGEQTHMTHDTPQPREATE